MLSVKKTDHSTGVTTLLFWTNAWVLLSPLTEYRETGPTV